MTNERNFPGPVFLRGGALTQSVSFPGLGQAVFEAMKQAAKTGADTHVQSADGEPLAVAMRHELGHPVVVLGANHASVTSQIEAEMNACAAVAHADSATMEKAADLVSLRPPSIFDGMGDDSATSEADIKAMAVQIMHPWIAHVRGALDQAANRMGA